MYHVKIQVKELDTDWERITKVNHSFKDWKDVSIFAYRLAKQTDREVRVENNGNGHYYAPHNAEPFLNEQI